MFVASKKAMIIYRYILKTVTYSTFVLDSRLIWCFAIICTGITHTAAWANRQQQGELNDRFVSSKDFLCLITQIQINKLIAKHKSNEWKVKQSLLKHSSSGQQKAWSPEITYTPTLWHLTADTIQDIYAHRHTSWKLTRQISKDYVNPCVNLSKENFPEYWLKWQCAISSHC